MKTLSRGLSLLALLAWGALMLYFYFSGRLADYLIPAYRPLVAVSGFVMLAIAAVLAWGMRPGAATNAGLVLEDRGDELSSPRRVRTVQVLAFALLVLPVWAAAGVSRDQFNATTIENKGIVSNAAGLPGKPALASAPAAAPAPVEPPLPGDTPAAAGNNPPSASSDATQYIQRTPDGHLLLEVTDLLFAADDDTLRPQMEGRTAEMIGQFMPAKDDASGRRFQLVRMFMVCCAADARPVAVTVEKPANPQMRAEADKLPELGWVRVTGKVEFPLENGRRVAMLRADKAVPTDPPKEAMLY
ncbi:MAG: TIGR03943 family protein [Gluconacetobacter diazotrophicus]|nr:TIGR03943 family protein [Gluconacetobacter diazotrophicus]